MQCQSGRAGSVVYVGLQNTLHLFVLFCVLICCCSVSCVCFDLYPIVRQIKAKALQRAVDIGRPSIPPQQLEGLWAMAQDNPEALAQRFGAPKVLGSTCCVCERRR